MSFAIFTISSREARSALSKHKICASQREAHLVPDGSAVG